MKTILIQLKLCWTPLCQYSCYSATLAVVHSPGPASLSYPKACSYDFWDGEPRQWWRNARRSPSTRGSQIAPSQRLWWEHRTCTHPGLNAPAHKIMIFIQHVMNTLQKTHKTNRWRSKPITLPSHLCSTSHTAVSSVGWPGCRDRRWHSCWST